MLVWYCSNMYILYFSRSESQIDVKTTTPEPHDRDSVEEVSVKKVKLGLLDFYYF